MHEAGHGIYEQNISEEFTRTAMTTDFLSFYAVGELVLVLMNHNLDFMKIILVEVKYFGKTILMI